MKWKRDATKKDCHIHIVIFMQIDYSIECALTYYILMIGIDENIINR